MKKRVILFLAIVFIIVIFSFIGIKILNRFQTRLHEIHETHCYLAVANGFYGNIMGYIEKNNGDFPSSEEDLINQYFLKKEKVSDGFRYYLTSECDNPTPDAFWNLIESKYFETFKLSYGASLDDIYIVDNRLYDRKTNERFLLIDVPTLNAEPERIASINLKKECETMTWEWYNQMVRYQKDESVEVQEAAADNGR